MMPAFSLAISCIRTYVRLSVPCASVTFQHALHIARGTQLNRQAMPAYCIEWSAPAEYGQEHPCDQIQGQKCHKQLGI